ncbi:YceI family protein [Herbiconiux moechotypicola]|uniref:Lipid/polyisoprenoid-binding YceI-like domain-containing protein n=1 Tax=Herbiconiux moechotypicola TaxID=637393 RepID=A0ABN3D7M1_9MICO|nr:YceI family protein [Herbiconiux moechotypicola]MCS5728393.1 YceI family protein [Herbiconiux moechotypicola]
MNRPAKYTVALIAGVAAVGVVAVVAVPIVSRGAEVDMTATLQQVVPTVFDSPENASGDVETSSWSIDSDSVVGYRMTTGDDLEISGSTDRISGRISVTGDEVSDAEFMVDLSTLVGDDPARAALFDTLIAATGGNSMASFVLTSPVTLPDDGSTDEAVPIVGVLTLRGISNEVSGEAELDFDDETGTISGSIPIDLGSYGIPTSLGPVELDDTAHIDVELVTVPAS